MTTLPDLFTALRDAMERCDQPETNVLLLELSTHEDVDAEGVAGAIVATLSPAAQVWWMSAQPDHGLTLNADAIEALCTLLERRRS